MRSAEARELLFDPDAELVLPLEQVDHAQFVANPGEERRAQELEHREVPCDRLPPVKRSEFRNPSLGPPEPSWVRADCPGSPIRSFE